MIRGLAYALALTWLTEGIVTLLLTRRKSFVLYNFWCNALTNPLMNVLGIVLMYKMPQFDIRIYYTAAETAVILSETTLYAFFDKKRHSKKFYFLLSLATNAASLAFGAVLSKYRLW
ncbi:MAG: hypothetical protein J6A07_06915 [Firmicutes bacterium]|nr:hypothetical protein [Bacillota bacterium]